MRIHTHKTRHAGFSVVELLVGLALSLMLLVGVLTLFANSRKTYESTERLARIQENARFALDQISRDIRGAGYKGCARRLNAATPLYNRLMDSGTVFWNFAIPLQGYEATSTSAWSPTFDAAIIPSATGGNDILVARRPRQESRALQLETAMTPDLNATIDVRDPSTPDINVNDTVLISTCRAASVLEVTGYTHSSATGIGTIAHAGGAGTDITTPDNLDGSAGYQYDSLATVLPIETAIYYVRLNATTNVPSLYRRIANNVPEEIIEGVEGMQIVYGVDANGDLEADAYQTAQTVETANQWGNVIGASISLLIRSDTAYGTELDSRTYDLLGTTYGPFNDRFQRSVFTTTVTLRNKAL
jgi:type IV pilus assembly protein PilW